MTSDRYRHTNGTEAEAGPDVLEEANKGMVREMAA